MFQTSNTCFPNNTNNTNNSSYAINALFRNNRNNNNNTCFPNNNQFRSNNTYNLTRNQLYANFVHNGKYNINTVEIQQQPITPIKNNFN